MKERKILKQLIEEVQAFESRLRKNFEPVPYYAVTEENVHDLRSAIEVAQRGLDELTIPGER
jgi:hypothetical protein